MSDGPKLSIGGSGVASEPDKGLKNADANSPAVGTTVGLVRRLTRFDELGVTLALVALILIITAFHPDFLSKETLLGILRQASFVAIIGYGMVYLLAMTEIDLSVGGIYIVSIIGSALLMERGVSPWLAAGAGVLIGAFLGLINGVLAQVIRVPAIIITLGTLSMWRGLAQIMSDNQPVPVPSTSSFFTILGGDIFGIPVAVVACVALGFILTVVFTRTRYGAQVRAIGSNHKAARFSGVGIGTVSVVTLVMVGALCGISGMLSLAFFGSADPTLGTGLELQVIAAAVIGGTALSGGRGTVPGAFLGALIIEVINSGLVFFRVPSTWNAFVTGAVIVLAVGIDAGVRRRRAQRQLEAR